MERHRTGTEQEVRISAQIPSTLQPGEAEPAAKQNPLGHVGSAWGLQQATCTVRTGKGVREEKAGHSMMGGSPAPAASPGLPLFSTTASVPLLDTKGVREPTAREKTKATMPALCHT